MAIAVTKAPDMLFTVSRRRSDTALPPDQCDDDPAQTAKAAGLRYVTDLEPGIRRERRRSVVRYVDASGEKVTDVRVLARIKAIVIPPAWTDVWICRRANGHLQATGRDERGRKQYRYHPQWRVVRDEAKYERMIQFGHALPAIRTRVEADLGLPGLPREKVLATVVSLLELTLIRVGNEEYARSNESYGLTTMLDDHVDLTGTRVTFSFRGKSGKDHEIGLRDRRLSNIVRRCRDLPGQTLFQYKDDAGGLHAVGSADVNEYLKEISGLEFTAKDFRTWFGTVLAAQELQAAGEAGSEREQTRQVTAAITAVAARLGNTPSVCRKCYVHPAVIESYHNGQLHAAVRLDAQDGDLLPHSPGERLVLGLLQRSLDEAGSS